MFNIGGGELIVILLLALIVLGPQRLPDAARQVGKAMGDLRRLSTGFQNEMRTALDTADDPNRIADRRNPLATEPAAPPAQPTALKPATPSAQARAAGKKAAAKKATPVRKTPLKAAPVPAKKASKPAPRSTNP